MNVIDMQIREKHIELQYVKSIFGQKYELQNKYSSNKQGSTFLALPI